MHGRSFQKGEVHLECHIRADDIQLQSITYWLITGAVLLDSFQRRRKENKYQSKPRWEGDPIRKAIDQVYPCPGNFA